MINFSGCSSWFVARLLPSWLRPYCFREVGVILVLGFASGLPLLLVFGTLSVWLREAGIERTTITLISLAGAFYGFKSIWAPLVDSLRIPVLGKLGKRRSWLLCSQLSIVVALLIMFYADPLSEFGLILMISGAALLGFSSATQDIVVDAYRIEIAPADQQSLLAGVYIVGYRIGMLAGGAGALEIASYLAEPTIVEQLTLDGIGSGALFAAAASMDVILPDFDNHAWQLSYLSMALLVVLLMLFTLAIKEPVAIKSPNHHNPLKMLLHFLLMVTVFVLVLPSYQYAVNQWLFDEITRQELADNPLSNILGNFLSLYLAFRLAFTFGYQLSLRNVLFPAESFRQVYVAPFVNFYASYGRIAWLFLLVVCFYRISDIVMGIIAKTFYVDMGYTKQQISRISFGFGLIMTIIGGVIGGILSIRFGILKILLAGALLSACSNLVFIYVAHLPISPEDAVSYTGWLSGFVSDEKELALILAIIMDNLSGGMAGAVAVAFISTLVNVQFSATQFAVFTSLTTLLPKVISAFSGAIVDGFVGEYCKGAVSEMLCKEGAGMVAGYQDFFTLTALLGIPVVILILCMWRPYTRLVLDRQKSARSL